MKQKKQTEKKLSLKKLQMVRISNPKVIMGGVAYIEPTTKTYIIGDGDNTGTIGTSRKD